MKNRLYKRTWLISLLSFMIFFGTLSSPSYAASTVVDQHLNTMGQLVDWFFSHDSDPSQANDQLDRNTTFSSSIGFKGILKATEQWKNFWQRNEFNGIDEAIKEGRRSEEKELEKLRIVVGRWIDACEDAGKLVKDDYLPLLKEAKTLADNPKFPTDKLSEVENFSNEVLKKSVAIAQQPTCLYALANMEMSYDDKDYTCAQSKILSTEWTNGIKINGRGALGANAITIEQFTQKGEGAGKCGNLDLGSQPNRLHWRHAIPGASTTRPSIKLDGSAEEYYLYKAIIFNSNSFALEEGLTAEAKAWEKVYKAAQTAVTKDKATLKKLQAILTGSLENEAKTIADNTAEAAKELQKGSVVGLSLPVGDKPIPEIIKKVIQQILGIVGALGLVGFIYGGLLYMTAAGNTERAEKGRKTLVWSTMGLVVIFASYAIVGAIINALLGK